MKVIWLIGLNFLREQRWPVLVLLFWVAGSSLASGLGTSRLAAEDVLFFLKTQAVYGVVFIAFLASAAIHNERKSRRILAVLSKGVRRSEYIAGLLGGVLAAGAIYVLAMGVTGTLMFRAAGLHLLGLWEVLALVMTTLVVTSTVAMFFSTFMTPLFATVATALALGTPAIAARLAGGGWTRVLPVYQLMNSILDFSVAASVAWAPAWSIVVWSLVDSLALWFAGSWLFSYRDIAVAIE